MSPNVMPGLGVPETRSASHEAVLMDQASDAIAMDGRRGGEVSIAGGLGVARGALAKRPVRPVFVVTVEILTDDRLEMTLAEMSFRWGKESNTLTCTAPDGTNPPVTGHVT